MSLNIKTRRRKLIFYRFILSYILILIVPLLIASIAYYNVVDIIKNDQLTNTNIMLEHSENIIDNYIHDIDKRILQLSFEPQIGTLLTLDKPDNINDGIFNVWQIAKNQKFYTGQALLAERYYMYFMKSELVMCENKVNFGFSFFYQNFCKYENMSFDQWNNEILNKSHQRELLPAQVIEVNGVKQPYITYVQSLPYGGPEKTKGVFLVLIDEKTVTDMLGGILGGKDGLVFILDQKGQTIASIEEGGYKVDDFKFSLKGKDGSHFQKVNGRDMLLTYSTTRDGRLKFVAALPNSIVMQKVDYIRQLSLIISILSLVVGGGIAILVTYRNLAPFQKIVSVIKETFMGDLDINAGEYAILSSGISKLISSNQELRVVLNNQSLLLKANALDKLFSGDFYSEKDMNDSLEHLGILPKGNYFAVVLMTLSPADDNSPSEAILQQMDLFRAQIEGLIRREFVGECLLHIAGANELTLLMSFMSDSEENAELIERVIARIDGDLRNTIGLEARYGVGQIKDRLSDVCLSKWEADTALKLGTQAVSEPPVFCYSKMLRQKNAYFYPIGLEQQLISHMKCANEQAVRQTLESLWDTNLKKIVITAETYRLLLYNLTGTLMKTIEETDVNYSTERLFQELFKAGGIDRGKSLQMIQGAFADVCRLIEKKKKSHNTPLVDEITNYIRMNFADANLSASLIASRYHLSESYFSQFFKEQTGATFSNYVEDLRIKKACEMLGRGCNNIEEVSSAVGYYSSHTFRRAFKRLMGIPPTEYKA